VSASPVRPPAVAGQFYPANARALERAVAATLAEAPVTPDAVGVMMPHAGYVYSGAVAGETISRVEVPGRVVLLGPNHTGRGAPVSVYPGGAWSMPFGEVAVDEELSSLLLGELPEAQADEEAHRREHSLEVQLPFLHYRRGRPLRASFVTFFPLPPSACRRAGRALAAAIGRVKEPVLIVASSDMNHYESERVTLAKDPLALERVLALDPDGLLAVVAKVGISMCGAVPTAVMLHAAIALGAKKAGLVRHTTSAQASGDAGQVVGYAGVVVSR
jgi:MEMO1 family protein